MRFQFLPHTADIRMKIEADTLPLLFSAGMKGMSQILKEDQCHEGPYEIHKILTVKSADITCLLIDFLSDVLTYCYTEKAVFCEVHFLEFSQKLMSAKISGKPVDGFDEEIKAVTYHEAAVNQNTQGIWDSIVVFDI